MAFILGLSIFVIIFPGSLSQPGSYNDMLAREVEFPSGLGGKMSYRDALAYKLPPSLAKPNVAVSINSGSALTYDDQKRNVNLASGLAYSTSVDAGIFGQSINGAQTNVRGDGRSRADVGGHVVGNGGASATGSVMNYVPGAKNGFAFANQNSHTSAQGDKAHAKGKSGSQVGQIR